jgi:beta-galactosidase/beta-glucuronidase
MPGGIMGRTHVYLERTMKPICIAPVLLSLALGVETIAAEVNWQPAKGPLMTRWAKDVSPKNAHPEYPRPQLVRKDWMNLNGLWDYAITEQKPEAEGRKPDHWDGQILVPFGIESALSGVMKRVYETNGVWYRRTFTIPRGWRGKRVLLNFGGVDWQTTVWVNGKEAGKHQGGYDGFSFDITEALHAKGENEIVVSVWDPTDAGPQPRGKQVRKPGSIWYTPTSGIWQTVWLEPVNVGHIEDLKVIPDLDESLVTVQARGWMGGFDVSLKVEILDGRRVIQQGIVQTERVPFSLPARIAPALKLKVPEVKPWSPERPHLYGLHVTLQEKGKAVDDVTSYFGMRKVSLARDGQGRLRIQLNDKPYFMLGPLDQGFWPDGLYTAPTDEALRHDIDVLKKLGFNMARKHVKVEPERWYYWCDKLGLPVWQDMPSGDKSAEWHGPSGVDGKEMTRSPKSAAIYERELKALVEGRYNHPCIVTWVPFNEGWGQFDTARILNLTKQLDPTRLVDGASGGNHFPAGDIIDHHQYPGPGAPEPVKDRAMVLGEFGGLGLPVKGHTWQSEKNWGYRSFKTSEELTDAYVGLIQKLRPMIEDKGLSAAIYTQTTDVEVEVNGLMTYDRAVVKMDEKRVREANMSVYPPPQGSGPSRPAGKLNK